MSPTPFKLGDHCRAGHLLTEENTYTEGTRLRCLDCLRARKPLKGTTKKEFCVNGHPRTPDNVNAYGLCKTCARERMADRRANGQDPNYKGTGQGAYNAAKTHCPYGHEYTEENTIIGKNGARTCKACYKESHRLLNIKKHNITEEQRDLMVEFQGNKCKICRNEFEEDDRKCFDHDHECCPGPYSCGNCIRGVLCSGCNRGLGDFRDDEEYLANAIEYLQEYKNYLQQL